MPSAAENRPRTRTIVLCHIDSLCCLPALNAVFAEFGDDIGLVLSSRRFGSRHGTFWEQTTAGFRRFGIPLNLWLGFDLVSVPIVAYFARWLSLVTRRPRHWRRCPSWRGAMVRGSSKHPTSIPPRRLPQ